MTTMHDIAYPLSIYILKDLVLNFIFKLEWTFIFN